MNHLPLRRSTLLAMHPDPILCAGLAVALRQHAAFEVFVHGTDEITRGGIRVDVVIADYSTAMRLTDSPARDALGLPVDLRILALTSNDREVDIRRAIEAGVHGYLLVGGPLNELIDAVTTVASGMRYMSLSVAQRMADSLTRATLTSRESEVLALVATGQQNKVIARRLSIELGTVKSHVSAIMTKLGASSRTEAATIAASRGLLEEQANREYPRPCARAMEPRMQFA
jgi:DNA-binding NarL/FixJ family response regulator